LQQLAAASIVIDNEGELGWIGHRMALANGTGLQ